LEKGVRKGELEKAGNQESRGNSGKVLWREGELGKGAREEGVTWVRR